MPERVLFGLLAFGQPVHVAFGVGVSSVKRYVTAYGEGRTLVPRRRPGSKPKLDEGARRLLESDLEERPTATLPQRREFLLRVCGVEVRDSTVCRVLGRMVDPKKRSMGATERDEWLRAAWRTLVAGELDVGRLVFVDEMGINTSLFPLYAWSRRAERALASVARNRGANVTMLASVSLRGMGPCLAVEGPTTREVFEAYLERALAPSLRLGQVVVRQQRSPHREGWRPPTSMILSYLGFPCYVVAVGIAFWSPVATLIICGALWVVWTIMAPTLSAE